MTFSFAVFIVQSQNLIFNIESDAKLQTFFSSVSFNRFFLKFKLFFYFKHLTEIIASIHAAKNDLSCIYIGFQNYNQKNKTSFKINVKYILSET